MHRIPRICEVGVCVVGVRLLFELRRMVTDGVCAVAGVAVAARTLRAPDLLSAMKGAHLRSDEHNSA